MCTIQLCHIVGRLKAITAPYFFCALMSLEVQSGSSNIPLLLLHVTPLVWPHDLRCPPQFS